MLCEFVRVFEFLQEASGFDASVDSFEHLDEHLPRWWGNDSRKEVDFRCRGSAGELIDNTIYDPRPALDEIKSAIGWLFNPWAGLRTNEVDNRVRKLR